MITILGQVDWTALINMVSDAIMEIIMVKVYNALLGTYSKLPAINAHTGTVMDTPSFDALINVIKAYGTPIIIGTPLAVQQVPLNFPAFPSEQDKADIRSNGFLGMYKGLVM